MSLIRANGGGLGGAGAPGGALGSLYSHLLDQSLKFDDGTESYLSRTPASAGNRKTWTWSSWVKLSALSGTRPLFTAYIGSGSTDNEFFGLFFDGGKLRANGYSTSYLHSTAVFRDPSAWYHIVCTVDTTDSTANNRMRFYVNGVELTDFSARNNPSINTDLGINQAAEHQIGQNGGFGEYFDGYIAEVNFIDGTALDKDSFGETKNGIWIPKDTSGLTFGTNGFHLTFKDDVVSEGFNTALYNATEANQSISGIGFQPDLVFAKNRDSSSNGRWGWIDSVRGVNKTLATNMTAAEVTSQSDLLKSFDGDGFSLGADANAYGWNNTTYTAGDRQVAFCWEAGGPTPSQTYTVKVVSDSGNKYRFDDFGTSAVTLNLQEGGTYTFDQSDSSNSGHPLRFSTTSNGTHGGGSEYTTGVTTTGTPGNAGAKTVITVAASAATLYYYCTQHSGMGGQANTNATFGSTHLDGSILSTVSANTARGFSIVTFTGNGSAGATIAHGLGAAPEWIILKSRDNARDWRVYHTSLGATKTVDLNKTGAEQGPNAAYWNNTAPTSSVFSVGNVTTVNGNGEDYIAYCWTPITGYSSFGTYTGDGTTDGSKAITTGFRPAFLMIKRTDTTGNWEIFDDTRGLDNDPVLYANANTAESAAAGRITFTSTGFTLDDDGGGRNASSGEYIYMAFADTREAAFFKDVTTNGNHWTPVNLDYRDSVPDVPTNNFATYNPIHPYWNLSYPPTISNGNLQTYIGSNHWTTALSTLAVSSGKWYAEFLCTIGGNYPAVGILDVGAGNAVSSTFFIGAELNSVSYYNDGNKYISYDSTSSASSYGDTFGVGDIIGVALDLDAGTVKFYKNNTVQNSGTAAASSLSGTFAIGASVYGNNAIVANYGQDSSFRGIAPANANADSNGHGSFFYAPPSEHLALCSQNLPDPAITDGTENFNSTLWTGNGASSRAISGIGYSPDLLIVKNRGTNVSPSWYDKVRGAGNDKELQSDSTLAEGGGNNEQYGYLSSFDSDGFTGVDGTGSPNYYFNENNKGFVAWNWKAGGSTTSYSVGDDDGTHPQVASNVSANPAAGFSIVTWTAPASSPSAVFNEGTIKHGLSKQPEAYLYKTRSTTSNWTLRTTIIDGSEDGFTLDGNNGTAAPFAVSGTYGSADANYIPAYGWNTGTTLVAWCFHSVEGYSKIGTYTGNANADGTFVYTGFRPQWIVIKKYNASGQYWTVFDSSRDTINPLDKRLWIHLGTDESANPDTKLDFVSNGFKLRDTYDSVNGSGSSYFYLAFADQPFKFANAR